MPGSLSFFVESIALKEIQTTAPISTGHVSRQASDLGKASEKKNSACQSSPDNLSCPQGTTVGYCRLPIECVALPRCRYPVIRRPIRSFKSTNVTVAALPP